MALSAGASGSTSSSHADRTSPRPRRCPQHPEACEGTPSAHTFSPFVVLLLVTFLLKSMKRIVSQTRCSTGIGQRRLGTQLAVCARVCVYCIRISVMQEEVREE